MPSTPFLAVALGVGVFDAQDEGAPGVAGEEPVEQGRPGAADVEEPGGRGSETDPRPHAGGGGRSGPAGAVGHRRYSSSTSVMAPVGQLLAAMRTLSWSSEPGFSSRT